MSFDKEKWRAEIRKTDSAVIDGENVVIFAVKENPALALLERAYTEGRADGACEVIEMARRTAAAARKGTP